MGEGATRRRLDATDATDEALLAMIGGGEPAALAALHGRFAGAVSAVALRIVADRAVAEELTQEVFLRVWLQARAYDPGRGRAATWLLALARHRAIDHLRRCRCRPVLLPATDAADRAVGRLADPLVDVEREVWLADRHRLLAAAVGALPRTQREAIEQVYYHDLSHAQAGASLGEPLGTVKSRLGAGLRRLRAALAGDGFGPVAAGRDEFGPVAPPPPGPRARPARAIGRYVP